MIHYFNKKIPKTFVNKHPETQYLGLIHKIIKTGHRAETRNGVTISLLGESMRFSLKDNTIPIFTSKKMAWKTCLKELLWFISGDTDNNTLTKQNVHIWDGNASPEFMASRGLNYKEGDLGPIYGHQWRHFNAKYTDSSQDYRGKGVDQLDHIIEQLKISAHNNHIKHLRDKYFWKTPKLMEDSRRLIMSAWNPQQINEMALPPCHILSQFHVQDNKLSCSLYQRSGDVGLGIPFNVASYSFLTHLLAKHCGLEAHEFIHHIGDAHIYESHIEALEKQLDSPLYDFPKLEIENVYNDIELYTPSDFKVNGYKCNDAIKMEMIA